MIELTESQRETIETELRRFGVGDYSRLVELLILGELTGAEIISLIRVFCQTSYLKGRLDMMQTLNDSLKATLQGTRR